MTDPRIGTIGGNWPAVTVTGQPYRRPCNTVNIGGGYFVVLDMFHTDAERAAVEELRASVSGGKKAKAE